MFSALLTRIKQGRKTLPFPGQPPLLPERFSGRPVIRPGECPPGCRACEEACPTEAVAWDEGKVRLDLGRCLFCGVCGKACPAGRIDFTGEYRMAVRKREELLVTDDGRYPLAERLGDELYRHFGRSLHLRQVSAGGCNACEADVNVLGTVTYDLGRFGIRFVASPRHADGLLVTGPVTKNMASALRETYEAIPQPKIVIASGACALSGGPYRDHGEVHNGCAGILPVDLFVPGCPPHPFTLLDGLLRLIGKLDA